MYVYICVCVCIYEYVYVCIYIVELYLREIQSSYKAICTFKAMYRKMSQITKLLLFHIIFPILPHEASKLYKRK